MNDIQSLELWIIRELQNLGEWITPLMQFFTWLGYPQGYIIIIAIIYWSFNSRLGMRMAIFLTLVSAVNGLLKQLFHAPRPYWVDHGIKAFQPSNGFGMPSGHSQAATVWLLAACYLKNKWFWIVAVVLTFMIGLSRVYLGDHFPGQVVIGWLIGIVLMIIYIRFESDIITWLKHVKLINQLLFVVTVSILFLVMGGLFVTFLKDWEIPVDWVMNASAYLSAEQETIRSSIGLEVISGNAGGFLGTAAGIILITRVGGFNAGGIWWKRFLRCMIGLSVITGLHTGILAIAPDEKSMIIYCIWRYFGFFIIAFSVIFLIPTLYLKLNLVSYLNKITSKQ